VELALKGSLMNSFGIKEEADEEPVDEDEDLLTFD
jgi:hypothetical protein